MTLLTILAWTVLGMGYGLITVMGLGGLHNWRNRNK